MYVFTFAKIAGFQKDEVIVPMNRPEAMSTVLWVPLLAAGDDVAIQPTSINKPQYGKNSAILVLCYHLDPDETAETTSWLRAAQERETYKTY